MQTERVGPEKGVAEPKPDARSNHHATVPQSAEIMRLYRLGLDIVERIPSDDNQVNINPGLQNIFPQLASSPHPPTGDVIEQFEVQRMPGEGIRVSNRYFGFEAILGSDGKLTITQDGPSGNLEAVEVLTEGLRYIHMVVTGRD